MQTYGTLRAAVGRYAAPLFGLCTALALLLITGAWRAVAQDDDSGKARGAVYTETNAADGNAVAVFDRAADGDLSLVAMVPTGGTGTGGGLGNQGAVVLSRNSKWLFAVNAGSNEISVFAVRTSGLFLTDIVSSGGVKPVSVSVHGNLVYALNAGGVNNITGFTLDDDEGTLSPLPGSTRPLSQAATGPAEVAFNADGDLLAVTEKGTNAIDTYVVGSDGRASGPLTHPSAGMTPFGFAFGKRGDLVVSEAFGGAPNAAAVSSYKALSDGSLHLITHSAPTHQTAACWIAITKNGKFAYTTNTDSGSISGYRIDEDGSLQLLNPDGVTASTGAGSVPTDIALSRNSRYLFVLEGGGGNVQSFRVEADGSLTAIDSAGGLPQTATGLAAR